MPLFVLAAFAFLCAPLPNALAGAPIDITGTVNHNVYGNGNTPDGDAPTSGNPTSLVNSPNDNTVNVKTGGLVNGSVYGGATDSSSGSATATGNTVNLSGGAVTGNVLGGYARSFPGSATATGNIVTISGGTVSNVFGGQAYSGDTGSATATGNTVNLNGVTVNYFVYGGWADSTLGSATATGNTVNLSNATVSNVYGGQAYSGVSGSATATGNTVTISGGNVGDDVYGGYADSNGSGEYGIARNNSVVISGGRVSGDIFGGFSVVDAVLESGFAIGNTVTISGSPDLSASTLYGGFVGDNFSGLIAATGMDTFTGNTLNLKSSGLTVAGLYNFEYLNFYLPTTFAAGGTMLTVTGIADITGSTVNVGGIEGASSPLKLGDTMTLIDASAGTLYGAPVNSTANGQVTQGVTLKYEFELLKNGNKLLVNVAKVSLNEQTKALSEGWLTGMALVNHGADIIAGQGMDSAVSEARTARAGLTGNYGLATFGALSGGYSRFNTGSHVDMSSVSLLTGLSGDVQLTPGHLTLGAFFEYGNGSYDTHNSFANSAAVNGDGDMYYLGGGILGRLDFANTGPGHFYAEAAGHTGKAHNEYDSSDLRDFTGRKAEYDSSSAYYGLHLGTGYVWNINDKASLDLYGKYFWTRQEGDSVTLSTGDPVRFKDVDSSRLRFGSRFAYTVNDYISPYIGAAYEHEFDGKARATTNGYAIDAPKLRGDTGVGELGLTLTPSASLPLSFDLGVQGYVGKREGVTGSLQIKFKF
ncbi:MAG: autotransporter domain-containing protein [Planctomycetota bacterium]|nr:autotransporter domain-containing protein [Planctomycetota bacterium]